MEALNNSLNKGLDNAQPKLILAPMEGLTDPSLRKVLTQIASLNGGHGYDWCVTEFIRITTSLLPAHIWYDYCPELLTNGCTNSGTPVHVQLLGNDVHCLAENAELAVSLGAPAVDLNFGCPAKTVNRHRGGAVLLDEPELIFKIVSAVRRAVPSHVPVSAKMRLGNIDDGNACANAMAIADAGASWLTIHARTKVHGYRPPAYWHKIPAIVAAVNIPIIANGEIWNTVDAQRCQQESGCLDLMLGRGAVTRPDLIRQLRGQQAMPWQDLLPYQIDFLHSPSKLDAGLVGRYKQWLGMLTAGYSEAEILWQQIKRLKTTAEVLHIVQSVA